VKFKNLEWQPCWKPIDLEH